MPRHYLKRWKCWGKRPLSRGSRRPARNSSRGTEGSVGFRFFRGVLLPVLVEVRGRNVGRMQGRLYRRSVRTNLHSLSQRRQFRLGGQLIPEFHLVASRRHVADLETSIGGRYAEERRGHRDHGGTHLGMDIAKNKRHSWLRETHLSRCPALVESQVEGLPAIDGEDIVKERILVGELDLRADLYDDHVGRESFVF